MKSLKQVMTTAGILTVLGIGTALAVPILSTPTTWTGVGNQDGWSLQAGGGGTVAANGSRLTVTGPVPGPDQSILVSQAGGAYSGNYSMPYIEKYGVFEFTVYGATPPNDLSLYLYANNGDTYQYDLLAQGDPTPGGRTYNVALMNGSWVPSPGNSLDFMSDLASIQNVGVGFGQPAGGGITYGLDDFQIDVQVPEPGVTLMLLTVLMSFGMIFRGQVSELFGKARVMVRA